MIDFDSLNAFFKLARLLALERLVSKIFLEL